MNADTHGALMQYSRIVLMAVTTSVFAAACGPEATRSIPATPESIVGQITALDRGGERIGDVRVETQPSDSSGSPKAVVRVSQQTLVTTEARGIADYNDLRVGQTVRVWFTGPVRESYPVQAEAGTLVIGAPR